MDVRRLGGKLRVLLFTDTLGDVNGVSRFIRNSAAVARDTGRDLQVLTSTRMEIPKEENIHNVPPLWAGAMPGYANLEVVLPAWREMERRAIELRPDAIHISTPGPVGLVGRRVGRRLGVPMLGVYHTDFPAYIERLFENEALTWACSAMMRWFYGPFARVFTRSEEYVEALGGLGIERGRCVRLRPGIRVEEFARRELGEIARERYSEANENPPQPLPQGGASRQTHPPTPSLWEGEQRHAPSVTLAKPRVTPLPLGAGEERVRVLYVGRVSVEKNLPMLTRVWRRAAGELAARGLAAELVIVGDGPYREAMERELAEGGVSATVRFLGFRYGEELRSVYGSCHMFVFPSITDTLGQVVMESQAAGLPVVVSDMGGPKEVVRDGETGLVLPASDEWAWSAAIVGLVEDGSRRERMGHAAAAFMREYSIEESFEHFWGVHEEIAERG